MLTRRPRATLLVLGAVAALAACTGTDQPEGPPRRVAVIDRGDAGIVGLAPVRIRARPGDDVVVRNGSTDEDSSSGHALLTSPGGAVPPLFLEADAGAAPNPAVWGACRGGTAREGQAGCPVPPVEGPPRFDGRAYWSLGDLLPGEERVIPLADDLAAGAYVFWCAKHPDLELTLDVGEQADEEPVQARDPDPAPVPAPASATVLVAPDAADAEVLAYVPARIEVQAGQEVVFRADGASPHTVELGTEEVDLSHGGPDLALPTLDAWDGTGEARSGYLGSGPGGLLWSLRPTRPGTYAFLCRFAPGMTGELVVR